MNKPASDTPIDWSRADWEGSRREQMERWAALPLDRMILALEEMQTLHHKLNPPAVDKDKSET